MVCVVFRSAISALARHVNICNQVVAKICPINLTFKSLSEPMLWKVLPRGASICNVCWFQPIEWEMPNSNTHVTQSFSPCKEKAETVPASWFAIIKVA